MANVYKNKNFTKRNYECTNLVMQVTDKTPINADGSEDVAGNWVLVDPQDVQDILDLTGMEYPVYHDLEIVRGIAGRTFYGYM